MPVITITMTKEDGGATKKQKQKLASGMTKVFKKVFNGRGAKSATVIINEISTDNYAIGGKTISSIRKKYKQDIKEEIKEENIVL